jgi:glutamyl-tRNA synthetase
MPQFAHLPLLLKPDGNGKLSKRDGDRLGFPVFPLDWVDPKTGDKSSGYREAGYFPEAVVNFLALLGWHAETDQEFFSMDELIEAFSLERVSKSGAKFDYEKGKWFNHEYLIRKSDEELATLLMPTLVEKGINTDLATLAAVVGMTKVRCNFISDFWNQIKFFFEAPTEYDAKTVQKRWKATSAADMQALAAVLEGIEDFSAANSEQVVMAWITENGLHMGNIMNAFRLCIVGEGKGPHMFDITAIIGKEETLSRLEKAVEELK